MEACWVPRYYFDFQIAGKTYFDERGLELKDDQMARQATSRSIPTLVRQELATASLLDVHLIIRDEAGSILSIETLSGAEINASQKGHVLGRDTPSTSGSS
jgi:hypothetical protein